MTTWNGDAGCAKAGSLAEVYISDEKCSFSRPEEGVFRQAFKLLAMRFYQQATSALRNGGKNFAGAVRSTCTVGV